MMTKRVTKTHAVGEQREFGAGEPKNVSKKREGKLLDVCRAQWQFAMNMSGSAT